MNKELKKRKKNKKYTTPNKEIEARVEATEVKKICGKRGRMQDEVFLSLDEASIAIIHLDVNVQLQYL